jgi:hypothetical protein
VSGDAVVAGGGGFLGWYEPWATVDMFVDDSLHCAFLLWFVFYLIGSVMRSSRIP